MYILLTKKKEPELSAWKCSSEDAGVVRDKTISIRSYSHLHSYVPSLFCITLYCGVKHNRADHSLTPKKDRRVKR